MQVVKMSGAKVLLLLGIACLQILLISSRTLGEESLDDDDDSNTSFSCHGKPAGGFYADVTSGCRVFHACVLNAEGTTLDIPFACVNGTLFDQQSNKCLPESEVKCEDSQTYFSKMTADMLENKVGSVLLRRRREMVEETEETEERNPDSKLMVKEFPFPKYSATFLPKTHFSCREKEMGGYYADPETDCQMFHICALGFMGEILDFRFLCLNATLFNAKSKKCEDFQNVECPEMMTNLKTTMATTPKPSETKSTEKSEKMKDEMESKMNKDEEEVVEEEEENIDKSDDKTDKSGKNLKKEALDDEENESDDSSRGSTKKKPSEDKKPRPVPLKDLDYVDEDNDESAPVPIIVAPSFDVLQEGYRFKRQAFIPPPDPKSAPCYDYSNLPATLFSCRDKVPGGYYADPATDCQMYHICIPGPVPGNLIDFKFLCTNNTVFDQQTRMCRQFDSVDCANSVQFYELNPEFAQAAIAEEQNVEMEQVKEAELEKIAEPEVAQINPETGMAGNTDITGKTAEEIAAETRLPEAAAGILPESTTPSSMSPILPTAVPPIAPIQNANDGQSIIPEIAISSGQQTVPPESPLNNQPTMEVTPITGQPVIANAGMNDQILGGELAANVEPLLEQTPLNGPPILNGQSLIPETALNTQDEIATRPESSLNGQSIITAETPLNSQSIIPESPLNGQPAAEVPLNEPNIVAETPINGESVLPGTPVNMESILKQTAELNGQPSVEETPINDDSVFTGRPVINSEAIETATPLNSEIVTESTPLNGQSIITQTLMNGASSAVPVLPQEAAEISISLNGEPVKEEVPVTTSSVTQETPLNNEQVLEEASAVGQARANQASLNGEPTATELNVQEGTPLTSNQATETPMTGESGLEQTQNGQRIAEESSINGEPVEEEILPVQQPISSLIGQPMIPEAAVSDLPDEAVADVGSQEILPEIEEETAPLLANALRQSTSKQLPPSSMVPETSNAVPPVQTIQRLPQEPVLPATVEEQTLPTLPLNQGHMIPPFLSHPFEPFYVPITPHFFPNILPPRPFLNESMRPVSENIPPRPFTRRPRPTGILPPMLPNFGMQFPFPIFPRHIPLNPMFPMNFQPGPLPPMFPRMTPTPPTPRKKFSPITTEAAPEILENESPATQPSMRPGFFPPVMTSFPEPLLGLGSTKYIKKKISKLNKNNQKEISHLPMPLQNVPSETIFENEFPEVPAGSEFVELWLQPPPVHVHAMRIARELHERPNIQNLPKTSFSCMDKITGGYYADLEIGCQMFHICARGTNGEVFDFKFLCTNDTVFNQASQTCDIEERVNCDDAPNFYPKEPEKDIEVPDSEIFRTNIRKRRALHPRQETIDGDSDDEIPFPQTSFTCRGKPVGGYFADPETECRMFHVCSRGEKGHVIDFRFRCANDTAFNQRTRTCDEVDEVDCDNAAVLFNLDDEFYDVPRNSNTEYDEEK